MNRHEDELEKEIADKYIENMDAPDLWEKIEAGLDAVDAQRVQDKKSGDKKFGVKKDRKDRNSFILLGRFRKPVSGRERTEPALSLLPGAADPRYTAPCPAPRGKNGTGLRWYRRRSPRS